MRERRTSIVSFQTNVYLSIHIKSVHEKNKPFECEQCNYKGTANFQLNTHVEAVHEGKKPHECDICGKKWARKFF